MKKKSIGLSDCKGQKRIEGRVKRGNNVNDE